MEVLTMTNSCSEIMYKSVCQMRKQMIVDPQQKFFRLLIDGLAGNEMVNVTAASALPVSASTVKQYIFRSTIEQTETGVRYYYLPFLNGKISRYLTLILSSGRFAKKWCKQNFNRDAWVIVDPLVPVISVPARLIAQKSGIKVAAVITDIPTLCTNMKGRKENIVKRIFLSAYQHISDADLQAYDAYIPLTESINDVVNMNNKPYIVVEGFADSNDREISDVHENYIMYAGGLYEKYGIKTLVEAFVALNRKDLYLYLFGDGPYVDELKRIQRIYPNIRYMGCISADEVVKYEKRALLLVNPRPTNEKFAKYSFPSKTMEYLLSGTAVVSTKLPGIPKEYFTYMYTFSDYTRDSILKELDDILSRPKKEIEKMGQQGHAFVSENKNNVVMAKKIIKFLREI
mgnify:CR=1 FL=1